MVLLAIFLFPNFLSWWCLTNCYLSTQPIERYLALDDWKFVLKIDTNRYHPIEGHTWVLSKNIVGNDIKTATSSQLLYLTTPIEFNKQKDKACFYYYIFSKTNIIYGPVLLLFTKEKNEWKLIAESISSIS